MADKASTRRPGPRMGGVAGLWLIFTVKQRERGRRRELNGAYACACVVSCVCVCVCVKERWWLSVTLRTDE